MSLRKRPGSREAETRSVATQGDSRDVTESPWGHQWLAVGEQDDRLHITDSK